MDMRYTAEGVDTVAQAVLAGMVPQEHAQIIALSGDLGAGKTTLTAAIARSLGVTEPVVSPTFVIAKFYPLSGGQYERLVHIDAYRIEHTDELAPLGWNELIKDASTLVIIEWPERVEGALPVWAKRFTITHHGDERHITSH